MSCISLLNTILFLFHFLSYLILSIFSIFVSYVMWQYLMLAKSFSHTLAATNITLQKQDQSHILHGLYFFCLLSCFHTSLILYYLLVVEPKYLFIYTTFISFTPSTQNLVAPNNIVTTSITFIVRIPLSSFVVHSEKLKSSMD